MPKTTAQIVLETLHAWGVDTVFGLAGDGINGIIEALRTNTLGIRYVPVVHEESAAFMATAHAKWTGRLGCCLATTGPGGIHLLNGLYDAKLDGAPVIALTGLPYHDLDSTHTQQDVPLDRLFADVAAYSARIMGAAHAANVTELACRTALARRGVAHLSLPVDVQEQEEGADERSPRNQPYPPSNATSAPPGRPDPAALDRAVEVLEAAERPAILAGQGALGAEEALLRVAERLQAPVAKALLGKAVMDDDHPLCTGGIGLYGTFGTHAAMAECDALLIVGSTFPYVEYYPKPGQARFVQVDRAPERLGLRVPPDVAVVADARPTLERLAERLRPRQPSSFTGKVQEENRRWRALLEKASRSDRAPMHPSVPVAALGRRLPGNAVLVTDSGHHTGLAARYIPMRPGMAYGVSGTLASMACALPYAISAGLAFRDRPVFAVVGDGGLAMQLGEFATAARLRLPILFLVLRNGTLGQIKWEQMLFLGNPEFGCDLPPLDYAAAADSMGGHGFRVDDPAEVERVLDEALAARADGRPVLIEARVDPDEPLLPAVVSETYAKNLGRALAKGTPGAEELRAALRRDPARSMLEAGAGLKAVE